MQISFIGELFGVEFGTYHLFCCKFNLGCFAIYRNFIHHNT